MGGGKRIQKLYIYKLKVGTIECKRISDELIAYRSRKGDEKYLSQVIKPYNLRNVNTT